MDEGHRHLPRRFVLYDCCTAVLSNIDTHTLRLKRMIHAVTSKNSIVRDDGLQGLHGLISYLDAHHRLIAEID